MTVSQELARFIVNTEYEDLPGQVVAAAKRFLIDTLGAGIGGATTPQGQAIQTFLGETGGPPEATVIGTRLRVGRLSAALGNGTLMRALELEDTLEEAFFHSAPGAIGSTLALLERHPCSGRELLAAVAVAYEVGVRIARAVSPSHANRGYHPTGTIGSFGGAAASARLLGLDEAQTAHALGIAGLQAAGIMQSGDPSWRYLTAIDGGRAAHLGVTAALMARSGFPGAEDIFEGPLGFCAMHSDSADVPAITRDLASEYLMPIVGIKLFPSSRPTHSPIAAALDVRERHGIGPDDIDRVVVKTFAESAASGDKPSPKSELDGQGSIQYLVAVALARGRYTLADVNPRTLKDAAVRRVLSRVTLEADRELDAHRREHPSTWPSVVEVHAGGQVHTARVDSPPGSAQNPPTAQQMWDKYRSTATRVIPASQAEKLWQTVDRLEREDDLSRFIQLWEAPA